MAPWQVGKEQRLRSGWTPLRVSTVFPSRFSFGGGRLAFPPEVAAVEVGAELSLAELLGQECPTLVCWGQGMGFPFSHLTPSPGFALSYAGCVGPWPCPHQAAEGPTSRREVMCGWCREGSRGGAGVAECARLL